MYHHISSEHWIITLIRVPSQPQKQRTLGKKRFTFYSQRKNQGIREKCFKSANLIGRERKLPVRCILLHIQTVCVLDDWLWWFFYLGNPSLSLL